MKNTSLHSIMSNDPHHLDDIEIQKLFGRHNYPHFELQDLKANPELLKKSSYASFLNLLQNWNKTVDDPKKQAKEYEYQKNYFIFSWLKWISVQNAMYVDSSLLYLQKWYNTARNNQTPLFMQKQNMLKSYAEQWQIRKSYKSNLPLEIDSYKRRAIFNIKNTSNPSKGSNQKENVKENKAQAQKYFYQVKSNKKEHSYLREVRQKQQMENYVSSFRKSKMPFYKTLTKDFYKKQFSQNKLEISISPVKEKLAKKSLMKDYRMNTSTQGYEILSRDQNQSLNKTSTLPFYKTTNSSFLKIDKNELDHKTTMGDSKLLNISNIDGIGLMVNPFDTKIKKKKRG